MSLVKRLWIAVGLIALAACLTSISINILSAKSYLENEIKVKNMDTANSLALSISQNAEDAVMAELLVSSQFDLGHYLWIEFRDVKDQLVVRKEQDHLRASPVPGWFKRWVPINPEPGMAAIQAGWRQLGTVKLQSDPSFAYDSIWSSALTLAMWFAGGALLLLALGTLFINSIVRPLSRVVDQAEALSERRFIEVKAPNTREFRLIVEGMNRLTRKIKALLDDESARLEKLKSAYEVDPLTGYRVREVHLKRVQSEIEREDTQAEGLMLLVAVTNLEELNREIGRIQANQLVKRLADVLAEKALAVPGALMGRLKGPDFNYVLPGAVDANGVLEQVKAAHRDTEGLPLLRLSYALVRYTNQSKLGELLSYCDKNLTLLTATSVPDLSDATTHQRSSGQWRQILETALKVQEFLLASFAVRGPDNTLLHTEAPARIQSSVVAETLVAGAFLPWARRFGLGAQIDLAILAQACRFAQTEDRGICVNLGFEAVCDDRHVHKVADMMRGLGAGARHIYLDVPEDLAFDRFDEFKRFCDRIAPLGCHIGVEHLDKHIGRLGRLSSLGLSYLKVSHSLVKTISQDSSAQTLLRGICTIGHTMGLKVIAEGVSDASEVDLLFTLGFDGLTGSAIS
jgi:EAL domain-containing protein (putative c-di-GMP-specific phosphodiesterase class I)/GGDEF domain-containing protein